MFTNFFLLEIFLFGKSVMDEPILSGECFDPDIINKKVRLKSVLLCRTLLGHVFTGTKESGLCPTMS